MFLIERFSGTLTFAVMGDFVIDIYIIARKSVYKEIPEANLEFSSFELMYGKTVRRPMKTLKQLWTDDHIIEEVKNRVPLIY